MIKEYLRRKVTKKVFLWACGLLAPALLIIGVVGLVLMMSAGFLSQSESTSSGGTGERYNGEFTDTVPIFDEIKGRGDFPDEVAQLAVGTAVKYRLLPSVILSQWAYESAWGKSGPATKDINFFGITWYDGCPFPQGMERGINGSEGGHYMAFPNPMTCFSYYGYMVASQSNFNASVGNQSPSESLLILGRGGYAAAGIDEDSEYFKAAMNIISTNKLTEYDTFAIEKWGSDTPTLPGLDDGPSVPSLPGAGNPKVLDRYVGTRIGNGQCYALTALYSHLMGGPSLGAGVTDKIDMIPGTDGTSAYQIGNAYDWAGHGWKVINSPKYADLKAGDIINWKPFSTHSRSEYGHTGVIASVGKMGAYDTYEQNSEQGQIGAKYTRYYDDSIYSIIRKVK